MGARWAWFAKCPDGHVYSGFSGGADDCYECRKPPAIEIECQHLWDLTSPCNCREEIAKLPRVTKTLKEWLEASSETRREWLQNDVILESQDDQLLRWVVALRYHGSIIPDSAMISLSEKMKAKINPLDPLDARPGGDDLIDGNEHEFS